MAWMRLWLLGVVALEMWGCTGDSTGLAVGTIVGTVTNSTGGGISGATVVVTPSAGTARPGVTTGASGTYTVTSVPGGSGSITISNLPANCAAPGADGYTGLTRGDTVTVNIGVPCTPEASVAGVLGTVVSNLGGAIGDVTVIVTPSGGPPAPAAETNAFGAYMAGPVPNGSGSVAISTLPPNCTPPSAASYADLNSPATATVDFTVSCTAPGAPFGSVSGSVTGGPNGAVFLVVVTPAGDSALAAVNTDTSRAYSVSGVPVGGNGGSGSVVATGAGGGQICGGGTVYSGLAGGATMTVNVGVTCSTRFGPGDNSASSTGAGRR
jgi:hypothetical protein